MPRRTLSRAPFAIAATAAALTVAACVPNQPARGGPTPTGAGTVSVSSTSDACRLSTTEAAAGTVTFRVRNDGADVTEFYLLGSDGLRVVAEAENIGPGLSRDLVVRLEAGATLGPHSVVLPAAGLGAGSTVGPASLVMRGEQVPAGSLWSGNPIAPWLAPPWASAAGRAAGSDDAVVVPD